MDTSQSINGNPSVLKESVDISTLTSANAYDASLYDVVSMPLTLNDTKFVLGTV